MRSWQTDRRNPVGLVLLTGLLGWGALQTGPILIGGGLQLVPATLALVAFSGALRLTGEMLFFLADLADWLGARRASGKEGTARWGRLQDLKKELAKTPSGPFWGVLAGAPGRGLFIAFDSNAYVIGPSGAGKGHTAVVPMILSIRAAKIITDFKPELVVICQRALEAMGQSVIVLNPFGLYTDRIGETASLNPLDVLADDLLRAGGLRDFFEDAGELAMQLYPEPAQAKGDDQFWRAGTRKLIAFALVLECLINGHEATLSDAARLIEDRQKLEDNLRLILGIDRDGQPLAEGPLALESADWAERHDPEELREFLAAFRARAGGLLKLMSAGESKTFDSFAEGAEQALSIYAFGRLSAALGRSSFDFDAIKDGKTILNIFIVGDASRTEATGKFFGLMQFYMQLKLKRHARKDVPVYLINDEAANYAVYGLVPLMTWARSFGIRLIQVVQNFAAYEDRHGKHAAQVLNSEAEIKLFLPGQRAESTIKTIVELLGRQSVMVARLSADKAGAGLREDMSESARPLMTEDELRRSPDGILIVRQHPPFLQRPVSYAAIHPWRGWVDPNPHHGDKPFLRKVALKLKLKLKRKRQQQKRRRKP